MIPLELIGIAICISIHGLFSAVEMAMVSCSRIRIHHMAQNGSWRANLVERNREHPEQFLSALMVAVNIATVVEAVLANRVAFEHFPRLSYLVSSVLLIPTVIFFAEVLPKSLVYPFADRFALWGVLLLRVVTIALYPIVLSFALVARGVSRLAGVDPGIRNAILTPEELQILVRETGHLPEIAPDDRVIVQRIFRFKETRVEEVMLPLQQVDMAPADSRVREVREIVSRTGRSRIPLYDGDRNRIVCFVRATELAGLPDDAPARTIEREPIRVNRGDSIRQLLQVFQRAGRHLAVVRNADGEGIGIVTLEDVIEEIVGEIEDEYD